MATGRNNNKSSTKNIRFPNELIKEIKNSLELQKNDNPTINFSSWVIDACEMKLKKNNNS